VRTMVGPPDQLQAAAAAMQEARGRGLVYEGLVAGTGFITLDPEVLTEVDEDYLRLSSLEAGFMPDLVPPDFLPYADAAVAELHARAASSDERQAALEADFQLASLLGQPTRVRRVTERLVNEFGMLPSRSHIRRALWGVGNADLAKRAVDSLTTSLNQRPSSAYSWGDLGDASAVESDRFARDQAYTGGALTGSFRAEMDRFPRGRSLMLEAYALLFESWAAVRQSQEGVDPMVDRIDDIVRQGPQSFPGVDYLIPLALVLEEHGQYTKAIDFLGRGGVFGFGAERYAAEILEFRGRLAEASGDIDLAITEYRRYVKIRAFAGPELQPELERVRAKLASLQGR